VTETGFVRVSSNPRVLPAPVAVATARSVLTSMRAAGSHVFVRDDVSPVDPDVPALIGHRQVTDAHLLTLARRNHAQLVTFDSGLAKLGGDDVQLLTF
jgi:toxin-antitoxin system PIN domain toxin